jgi:putative ABC transport system permease protein
MGMRWLRRIGHKPLVEKRLDSELHFHLEQQVADYIASGLSPAEARRRANLEFGSVEGFKEECREARWENQLDIFIRDFRFALRGLMKDWRFAFVSIFALALAIGAATAMFSVVDNALFEPFPYKDQKRLVVVHIRDLDKTEDYRSFFTMPEIEEIRKQNNVFEDSAGNQQDDVVEMRADSSLRLDGNFVTPGSFDFLGVPAFLGRSLEDADYQPGAAPVFVLRYKTWQGKFNSDPAAIGKTFTLNGVARTLIGVMDPRFAWGGAELWIPCSYEAAQTLTSGQFDKYWGFVARLKPGVSANEASADMNVIAKRLATLYPKDYPKHFDASVENFGHAVVPQQFRNSLYLFLGAVSLLLLIGCGNVANLLLARATTRQKEFAVRAALGASRQRLIRQLLVESLLLALGGAVLGVLFAWAGVRVLSTSMPDSTVASETVIEMNPTVLVFALAIGVSTIFIFGLVPALRASRCDLQDSLRDAGKGLSGTSSNAGLRNSVIVLEVALSLTLLFTAGLFIRSFMAISHVPLGFAIDDVLSARIPLPPSRYKTSAQIGAFYRPLLERLKSLPGVTAAANASSYPPFDCCPSEIEIAGKANEEKAQATVQISSEDYFRVLRIPFLEGRTFLADEMNDARKVAVINETLRSRYFKNENPIGQRVHLKLLETLDDPLKNAWFEIVGVVADAKNHGLENPNDPEVWFPYTVYPKPAWALLVRTVGNPAKMIEAIGKEVWVSDPGVAMADPQSMERVLDVSQLAQPRFGLWLVTVFSALGLILVTIGVYSVMAYATSRQTHEFGIRMALGADARDVLGMVLRNGTKLLLGGIGIGLVVSFAVARTVVTQLWGVSAYDLLTLVAVVVLLLIVGLAACWIPARRATRVDPVTALRYE